MKTPRYLIGAMLLFWGWQTGLFVWAVPMAIILEAPNFIRTRWELSLADLHFGVETQPLQILRGTIVQRGVLEA